MASRRSRPSRRSLAVAAAGLACLVFVFGCSRGTPDTSDVMIQGGVVPYPPHVGPSTVEFRMTDVAGHAVSGARVRIEANMTHPAMAPVTTRAREFEPGRYRATLDFSTAGDWILSLEARLPDGRLVDHTLEVRGVRRK